ncbi:uncharacterized protein LOC124538419 [Vanessa cardui]|uniref:uncharacterized protein LOC124538419 n=1 Tax=Vanessa cardui TaxID=171605 RepID=UPI001F14351A|nr:uncharacterized protein LOC124538419 [Vanessa cardui]
MKFVIFACVITFAFITVCGQSIPTKKCPRGEHSVLYCPQKAEPSCENPTVHDLQGPAACGIPDCFCNAPTVRDTKTNKCVPLSKCS